MSYENYLMCLIKQSIMQYETIHSFHTNVVGVLEINKVDQEGNWRAQSLTL